MSGPSATSSLRLEKQFTGENVNLWGIHLNTNFDLLDDAIAGYEVIALTADHTLTSSNYAADEARNALLKFTGTGSFIVTIPGASKKYLIHNALTGTLTVSTGAGATVSLDTGDRTVVYCDGVNVYEPGYAGVGLKAYISSVVAGGAGGNVPSPTGHAGKWLSNNGTIPFWDIPATTDLSDYSTNILGLQVALAVAL